jgi:DNA-directed RNA polymerase specialized sigma subunit
MRVMFASRRDVIRALLTYTDWWQPFTSSVFQVGNARRGSSAGDGIREGLLATLDERTELARRMALLEERDRKVLFLWYVRQLDAVDISRELRVSRRHCFRLHSRAIQAVIDAGEPTYAA